MTLTATRPALALIPLLIFAGGCPHANEAFTPGRTRWVFTMGHQGEGIIRFQASSEINGAQTGECRDAACRASVDDHATLTLTPVPAPGFRYKLWNGDPTAGLTCPAAPSDASGTLTVTITRNGACYVLFEAVSGPSTPTTPGVR